MLPLCQGRMYFLLYYLSWPSHDGRHIHRLPLSAVVIIAGLSLMPRLFPTISGFLVLWLTLLGDGHARPSWHYGKDSKTCYGTENGMATQSERSKMIKDLRDMYSNCTKVYGNVEIAGITMEDLKKEGLESLDFFDNIEEVAGYVLIAYVILPRISFPKLRIIWGDKTFTAPTAEGADRWEHFSLLVMSSSMEMLDMRSLRAVVEGRVGFSNTTGLCHWKKGTVDWNQILGPDYGQKNLLVAHSAQNDTCFKDESAGMCDQQCKYCWGSKAEHCQEIYRTGCASQCPNSMCFTNSSDPASCCSRECAAGCFGPSDKECFGCRSMRDDEVCVDKCPATEVYNPRKMEFVHNPDGKYAWVRECVKSCPSHMFVYQYGCVARCPEGYYPNETVCIPCEGPCPKRCAVDKPLSSLNIHEFINCTVIEGRLEIRPDTLENATHFFANGSSVYARGLTVAELEMLSTIEEITHFLFVQTEELTTLKFLRNLKKIGGRKKYKDRYGVFVTNSENLREMGLSNLKEISDGDVYIEDNSDLCYVYTLPWRNITTKDHYLWKNRHPDICEREGHVCDELCDRSTGCWGEGPAMCYSCQYFKSGGQCVRQCNPIDNVFIKGRTCKLCHEECANGCVGPDPDKCESCKNVILGNMCSAKCPDGYYQTAKNECQPCHENCKGCSGPENVVGDGGCDRCAYVVVESESNDKVCLPKDLRESSWCGAYDGLEEYYMTLTHAAPHLQQFADLACVKCHSQCKSCIGPGFYEGPSVKCQCKNLRLYHKHEKEYASCVSACPRSTFRVGNVCYACHPSCAECSGYESTQCTQCHNKHYIDYLEESTGQFNCTPECPTARPYHVENVCSAENEAGAMARNHKRTQVISGIIVAVCFLALMVLCTILFVWRRRVKAMKYLQPPDEIFEMHPEAKPNLTRLRLIMETQLKKGKILGYGAFGTVFQGIWYPDEHKKTKVLVAIKVLHESNPAAQKEMLDEAAIMASMENQYLAQLIGVSVGQQLMLVTPLFPLGNLLEYVQNNRTKIGSLALLRWCTQIAMGMAHLEEQRLVHRDLAARNVLVQTPYHVRITDFGLAKMLDYGEEELKIYEGKMPIKWLALECIQYKRYTHKSDVWAFGVTVWELLTFGEKPYRDVPLHQIPVLLEKGDRLPQPRICSLDIYLILIKCWMVDANTRPSFVELVEEFSRMMKDPGRYLVIEGDALLRLPSCSSTERRQLLEQWAEEDDEPSNLRTSDSINGAVSTPGSPVSPFMLTLRDSTIDVVPNLGECASRVGRNLRSGSASSHRYASDPVKRSRYCSSPSKPLVTFEPVATDVDNYLVPDSQHQRTPRSPTDESASAMLLPNTSYASAKYEPVIAEGAIEGEYGMDYYDYLKKSDSEDALASGDSQPPFKVCGLENREYMMGKNNNMKTYSEDPSPALGDKSYLPEAESVV